MSENLDIIRICPWGGASRVSAAATTVKTKIKQKRCGMNLQSKNSMGLAIQVATFLCCWAKEFSYDKVIFVLNEIN